MYDDIKQEIQGIRNRIAWIEQTLTQQELPNLYNRLNYLEQQIKYLETQGGNSQAPVHEQIKSHYWQQEQVSRQEIFRHNIDNRKIEANIGKYIIAILAALMIIASASLFVSIFWDKIGPVGQYAAIMLIGLAMTISSTFMIIKKNIRNGFTIALSSAGYTVIFLTILFGSINWNLYNVYIAGILVLIWTMLIAYAANYLRSSVYYVITYLGSITVLTSIPNVMPHNFSLTDQIVIIIAAIIWFIVSEGIRIVSTKNSDRASLIIKFASLIFILYEIILLGVTSSAHVRNSVNLILFVVLGLCVAFIIIADKININNILDRIILIIVSLISYICTLASVSGVMSYIIHRDTYENYDLIALSDGLAAIITIIVMIITAAICRKSTLTILVAQALFIGINLCTASNMLIDQSYVLSALVAIIISCITILNENIIKNKIYKSKLIAIGSIIYIQALSECLDDMGYELVYKVVALLAMLIPVIILYYRSVIALISNKDRIAYDVGRLASLYIFYILSFIFTVNAASDGVEIIHTLAPIIVLVVCHKLFILDQGTRTHKIELIGIFILSILLSLITYSVIAFEHNEVYRVLSSGLIMMLSVSGLYYSLKHKYTMFSVLQVIGLNVTTFLTMILISATTVYLAYSLCGVIISALLIIIGFKVNNKHIRITSLITMIIYVLKMGTIDMLSMGNTMTAVGTLFLSGIVCFIISYIYNKLDKKYSTNS